ncbi:hypothetical protein FOMPIDRAFT_93534 [Fomitopsis schrenkii]|uniref:Protein kinase domain-containing protein n=1 Tax=Fomitopsis schrenkii TaxID=2126942 RepID=S8FUD2_FOMSC|nr:hypothetical protein FOMPIDRAFT_93534 [Fomitopsis schrenkii]
MYAIKRFLFWGATLSVAPPATEAAPQLSVSSTIASCLDTNDGPLSTASSSSSFSTVASIDIRRVQDIFAAHEVALASGQDIHVRVMFNEDGEMVVANMEPLHEFNPCQDLSPPLKQEGFAPLGTDELPSKQKHQKKTRAYDYDKRLRNAVKLVRRAALVGAERAEGEVLDRAVNVGGRSLTWAVPTDQDAQRYNIKLMDALKRLHKHRILQRDIKPNSIVVSREERLTFADFTA